MGPGGVSLRVLRCASPLRSRQVGAHLYFHLRTQENVIGLSNIGSTIGAHLQTKCVYAFSTHIPIPIFCLLGLLTGTFLKSLAAETPGRAGCCGASVSDDDKVTELISNAKTLNAGERLLALTLCVCMPDSQLH